MTSTSFQIGLKDTRNSSRVLRPPGGGHTDIFGAHEAPIQPVKKVQESPIAPPNNEINTEESEIVEESNPQPQVTATPQQVPPVQAPQRKRVPPGGFSSGLW